jgi:CBS domain-containing protein
MSLSAMPVSLFMTAPVVSVGPETQLDAVHRTLLERRISSVPIVSPEGHPLGVISDTDLLRIGRLEPASLAGVLVLDLPAEAAGAHMHRGVIAIAPDTPVTVAASTLVEHRIHRVYVVDGEKIVGVFSTEDVFVALRQRHIETPIRHVMSTPVHTVAVAATLSEVAARLDRIGVSGLVVVDEEEQPVGVFTKTEVLRARHMPVGTKVEQLMSYSLLTLPSTTPAFRAAAHAYETRARRVLATEAQKLVGVLTGLDFARLLASHA